VSVKRSRKTYKALWCLRAADWVPENGPTCSCKPCSDGLHVWRQVGKKEFVILQDSGVAAIRSSDRVITKRKRDSQTAGWIDIIRRMGQEGEPQK